MSTRTTPYYKFPLYDPEAAPDLTETGEHDAAVNAIDTALHGEALARVDKDTELAKKISDEETARKAADAKLTADLAAETQARTDADTAMSERIDALDERETADKAGLEQKIKDEAAARAAADSALDVAYKSADTALGKRIDVDEAEIAAVTADLASEISSRKADDDVLSADLENEAAERADADTALGKRIDNAEVEISANSADLTGIKGLTYGADDVHLVEESNGEYSSPALTEIEHDIADAKQWQNVQGKPFTQLGGTMKSENGYLDVKQVSWAKVTDKPFSTVGSGLKVVSDALQVDTDALPQPETYTLPVATADTLGGMKVGTGLFDYSGDGEIGVLGYNNKAFITADNIDQIDNWKVINDYGAVYHSMGDPDASSPSPRQTFNSTVTLPANTITFSQGVWNDSTAEYDFYTFNLNKDSLTIRKDNDIISTTNFTSGINADTTWATLESGL